MSSGLDYAIGRGCREQSRSNWSYCVHTANMRLLQVWRDFHSGKIRGALYWKLGDGADCFDKFEPFAKLLSRKEHISSPCDKPHTGSIRLLSQNKRQAGLTVCLEWKILSSILMKCFQVRKHLMWQEVRLLLTWNHDCKKLLFPLWI